MTRLKLILEYPLESWGVSNPINPTSNSSQRISTTDIRTIITEKFNDARNLLWKSKVNAVDALLKNVVFLPLGSVIDADYNSGPGNGIIINMIPCVVLNTFAISLGCVPYHFFSQIINGKSTSLENICLMIPFPAIIGMIASTCFVFGMKLFYSEAIKVAAAVEGRMKTINSLFNDLNELYIFEKNLNEGQKDFNSLLLTCKAILGQDFIGHIGQEILANAQKPSPGSFPLIVNGC
jgi:hypothetical protein